MTFLRSDIQKLKKIFRDNREFTILINYDENVRGRYRITVSENNITKGYCALKPASNDYIRGYRITNYSVWEKGLGLGMEMIIFFEEWSNKKVIPSGIWGATGQLTQSGKNAAYKRLSLSSPDWLPDDWDKEFSNVPIL